MSLPYVNDAVDAFLHARRADGVAATTIRWYRSVLHAYSACAPMHRVNEITTPDLRSYIVKLRERTTYVDAPQRPATDRKLSPSSVDGHVTALHAFWAWTAVEYSIPNPMANIKRPRRRMSEPKAISSSDFVKLFNSTSDDPVGVRDRAILAVLADTGMRLGGLVGLKLADLDLECRRATVREKRGKLRKVVYTQATAGLLSLWLTVRRSKSDAVFVSLTHYTPLTSSGVAQMLKRLQARAGVTGRVNPHSFRHNFAREYCTNGGDIVTLSRLLGHSDISITAMYYAVYSQDELAAMHERYSPLKSMTRG